MFKHGFQFLTAIFIAMFCLVGCSNNAFGPTAVSGSNNESIIAKVGTNGALDVGVGGGSSNVVWAISKDSALGGYLVYKWNGSSWQYMTGAAIKIAVDQSGNAWVVNSSYNLFHYNNGSWIQQSKQARDVAIGANGKVWIISNESASHGGYLVYQLTGSTWTQSDVPGAGIRIAVDPAGYPWVVNSDYTLFKKNPIPMGAWIQQSKQARDVGIGANGSVWIVSNESAPPGGYLVYKLNGSTWQYLTGAGTNISCDASGNAWLVNALADIYQYSNGTWIKH